MKDPRPDQFRRPVDLGEQVRNVGCGLMALGCISTCFMGLAGFIAAAVLRGCQ